MVSYGPMERRGRRRGKVQVGEEGVEEEERRWSIIKK